MTSLKGSGEVVCYLDLDGTLHHEDVFVHPKLGVFMGATGHALFEWASILEQLLMPYPEVKIVLSTNWVPRKGYAYTINQLSQELKRRTIGATFHSRGVPRYEFLQLPRWSQIAADVERRKPRQWFALDDDDVGWPGWTRAKLIKTEGATGISADAVQVEIRSTLAQIFAH